MSPEVINVAEPDETYLSLFHAGAPLGDEGDRLYRRFLESPGLIDAQITGPADDPIIVAAWEDREAYETYGDSPLLETVETAFPDSRRQAAEIQNVQALRDDPEIIDFVRGWIEEVVRERLLEENPPPIGEGQGPVG
jgi:quinol monooxygenase YgiN